MKKIYLYDDNIGSVEYVQHMGEDITVVNSARVSFGKEKKEIDGRDRKLIQYLCRNKHTSTLEHNVVTFRFLVPLFVRSQHHRHRTWSYNEISRRYTDIDMKFYLPKKFRTQHKSNRQASNPKELVDPKVWHKEEGILSKSSMTMSELLEIRTRDCLDTYEMMLDRGVCREQARMVLPQNLYTEYYGTCNLNNLLKFIELRTHEGAQWEIQQVANACLEIATELWPITVNAFKEVRGDIITLDVNKK